MLCSPTGPEGAARDPGNLSRPRSSLSQNEGENSLAGVDERDLIAALRRKDMAALEGILETYGGPMATLAHGMLRDPVEAQDVVEEALVRVHEAGPGFRGERGLRTWLLRITANLCRDRLRRRRFTAGSLDGPVPMHDAALRFTPVADWDEALDQVRVSEALDRAIAGLADEQREAVVMRHRLELSYEEMSDALGVPLGTIKSRLARALAALREAMKEWER
jgi:RNA polymerase sigma-70 factor (ECF subfamily)